MSTQIDLVRESILPFYGRIGADITAAVAFLEFLWMPSFAARLEWARHSSAFPEKRDVGTTCKVFAAKS
jgi:hypothetical protein